MSILLLPNDIIKYITTFLSTNDKTAVRESCKELLINVNLMKIKIEKMDKKFKELHSGREYILSRLRLAALCGLHEFTVANIWNWITSLDNSKDDALPILRQISDAIKKVT